MKNLKVKNMISNNGNEMPNQFIINTPKATYFQSYKSIIVKQTAKKTILDRYYWNYSPTTSKYRNQFLNETTKETEQKIKTGVYTLADLNK